MNEINYTNYTSLIDFELDCLKLGISPETDIEIGDELQNLLNDSESLIYSIDKKYSQFNLLYTQKLLHKIVISLYGYYNIFNIFEIIVLKKAKEAIKEIIDNCDKFLHFVYAERDNPAYIIHTDKSLSLDHYLNTEDMNLLSTLINKGKHYFFFFDLLAAIENNNLERFKKLITDNFNNQDKTITNLSVFDTVPEIDFLLKRAFINENLDMIKYFFENGVNSIEINAVIFADILTKQSNLNIIKYLINKGLDIHVENELFLKTACSKTSCNLELTKFLIEQGADFHGDNDILLSNACTGSRFETIKYLMGLGLDINKVNYLILKDLLCDLVNKNDVESLNYLLNNLKHINADIMYDLIKKASIYKFNDILKLLIEFKNKK